MASKKKVLEDLKEKGYNYAEVRHIIGTITSIEKEAPSKLKVGDIFLANVGLKKRPNCIVKVTDCLIYAIPMSTTQDCLNLCNFKSRFFGNGFFANQLVSAPIEYVEENFAGVLDSPRDVRNAVKKLKELVNTL
jgi:hypothetical protein